MEAQKPVVAYFYDQELGDYCYGEAGRGARRAACALSRGYRDAC